MATVSIDLQQKEQSGKNNLTPNLQMQKELTEKQTHSHLQTNPTLQNAKESTEHVQSKGDAISDPGKFDLYVCSKTF